jgi:type II secretory ATPase GspE/PulE/Tfp pilus assembly ATPase PilB-like protein
MLMACGPTGSGKSTTLYAALQEVDTIARNVITIEDPIEYQLDNITQLNINERAGITFAKLLRNTLRQDPDILMVGEIRDKDTAEIAMQAALTGHFVYTTVHANDTVSSIFRLLDLSVKPYLIASSVSAILAQRLVRTLCTNCKVAREPTEEELENLPIDRSKVDKLYDPVGCDECFGTGYRGRTGVFELLEFNEELQDLVQNEPSIPQIKNAAKKAGLVSLRQDALVKALQGVTSLQEAIRVTR